MEEVSQPGRIMNKEKEEYEVMPKPKDDVLILLLDELLGSSWIALNVLGIAGSSEQQKSAFPWEIGDVVLPK